MNKIACILAATVICCLAAACTTPLTTSSPSVRVAVEADGSFDGKYQRRNVGEWADADLEISGNGATFRTFGSGCHRDGTPFKIVKQTATTIQWVEDYQGSIVGCATDQIFTLKKVMVSGKPALANWAGVVFYIKQ